MNWHGYVLSCLIHFPKLHRSSSLLLSIWEVQNLILLIKVFNGLCRSLKADRIRDRPVSVVTRVWARRQEFDSQQGQRFFVLPLHSDQLWGLPSLLSSCDIWGSHSSNYEDDCLLGCCAMSSGRCLPTFQRCLLPPSSDHHLLMEAASTYEMSVNFYQTTRCNNPEGSHFSIQLVPGAFPQIEGKASGADHSHLSSAEVNVWSYTSTLPYDSYNL
jgi:hypothetical protein